MIKSFELGAKTFKVKRVVHDSDNLGRSKAPLCEIEVQTKWRGCPVPEQSQEQTLMHEIVHCILEEIGREDLNNDETFVQSFSMLMYQLIETKK